MGYRYRKSVNLKGGVRINFSKSGVGYSIGTKGFSVTKTAKGTTRYTTSIPGTGISHVTETKSDRTCKSINLNSQAQKYETREKASFCIFFVLLTFSPTCVFMGSYMWCYLALMLVPGFFKMYYKTKKEEAQESQEPDPIITATQEENDSSFSSDSQDYTLEFYREHCFENAEMYEKYFYNSAVIDARQKMKDFLEVEAHKITKLLMVRKLEKAMESIEKSLHLADPIRDAAAIHWYLISALRDFYSIREEEPLACSYCLQICDYDLQNIENYFLESGTRIEYQHDEQGRIILNEPAELVYHRIPPKNLEKAIKKAIILEKLGRLDEAIDHCDYAIKHDIPDTNGKSFLSRKMRLEKKRENNRK